MCRGNWDPRPGIRCYQRHFFLSVGEVREGSQELVQRAERRSVSETRETKASLRISEVKIC